MLEGVMRCVQKKFAALRVALSGCSSFCVLSCGVQGHSEDCPHSGRWLLQARAFSDLLTDWLFGDVLAATC